MLVVDWQGRVDACHRRIRDARWLNVLHRLSLSAHDRIAQRIARCHSIASQTFERTAGGLNEHPAPAKCPLQPQRVAHSNTVVRSELYKRSIPLVPRAAVL